jgi:hypothetical protein
MNRNRVLPLYTILTVLIASAHSFAADIAMAQYNKERTVANLAETTLTTSNVGVNTFGRIFAREVDAAIDAQPLVLEKVAFPKFGVRNVVYVVTMHNSVYAFDADNASDAEPLWVAHLEAPDAYSKNGPELGILATPAISRDTGAMYLVSTSSQNGHRVFRLHALDLGTGAEKFNGPVTIAGQLPSKAPDAAKGTLVFTGDRHLVRCGLAIAGNTVYLETASAGDTSPSHGWIFGHDLRTLQRTAMWNDTVNGSLGGIWQSGRAPVVSDDGFLYLETGNGDYDGKTDFGESFLKLSTSGGISAADWFTPDYWQDLNDLDWDIGSSGPILIPGTTLLAGGSKTGYIYVLDTKSLGRLQRKNRQIVQSFLGTKECSARNAGGCAPITNQVFWPHPSRSALYVWGVNDRLRTFRFVDGKFDATPAFVGQTVARYPGGVLALSSNAGNPGTGILWALLSEESGAGTLHAFDASDPKVELWNSAQQSARDALGQSADFIAPVVVNGKVYMATESKRLVVYGLLP